MPGVDLAGWHDFFVIVGSSAGALTGLMFVVITLTQALGIRRPPQVRRVMRSFSTPTIVHFSVVLSMCAVLSMPRLTETAIGLFLMALSGSLLGYMSWVYANSRTHHEIYKPDIEDLVWHFSLPVLAYGTTFGAGAAAWSSPDVSLYMVGGSMVALLIIGIHNAWDSAVWQIIRSLEE